MMAAAAGAVMLLLDEQDAPLTEAEQKLVQTRLLHIVQNLLQSLLIHDKNFLS